MKNTNKWWKTSIKRKNSISKRKSSPKKTNKLSGLAAWKNFKESSQTTSLRRRMWLLQRSRSSKMKVWRTNMLKSSIPSSCRKSISFWILLLRIRKKMTMTMMMFLQDQKAKSWWELIEKTKSKMKKTRRMKRLWTISRLNSMKKIKSLSTLPS